MSERIIVDDENQGNGLLFKWRKHNVMTEIFKQSINEFLAEDVRLRVALEILGVKPDAPKHHRHVLISAIMMYAGANKDEELERQCDEALKGIRAESE